MTPGWQGYFLVPGIVVTDSVHFIWIQENLDNCRGCIKAAAPKSNTDRKWTLVTVRPNWELVRHGLTLDICHLKCLHHVEWLVILPFDFSGAIPPLRRIIQQAKPSDPCPTLGI